MSDLDTCSDSRGIDSGQCRGDVWSRGHVLTNLGRISHAIATAFCERLNEDTGNIESLIFDWYPIAGWVYVLYLGEHADAVQVLHRHVSYLEQEVDHYNKTQSLVEMPRYKLGKIEQPGIITTEQWMDRQREKT